MLRTIAGLVVSVSIGLACPALAVDIGWTPYTYDLKSGEHIEAQLGSITVPLHHADLSGARLTLRFVRLPGKGHGIPIVYLAGGPGGSGIESGRGDRWRLFDAMRAAGDVILLDQRGVGQSGALPPCSKPWSFPLDQATTEASVNASLEAAYAVCAAEWRAAGIDLAAYNAAENAADVADLATALGGKVNIVSISYGTFLGFALLRDHASVVNRAVFAGTEGPDHTIKLPMQADAVLDRMSARAAASPAASALTPNLRRAVETVLAQLDKAPVWGEAHGPNGTTVRVLISKYDVQAVTCFLMATSENAQRLPKLYAAMTTGNFGPMADMTMFMRKFLSNLPAMGLATDAASDVSPARERAVHAQVAKSLFGNAVNAPSADFRKALGVPPLPQRWYTALHTDAPAFFISGDLDSRTPPGNAEEVRKGFATSAHLVLHGAGHDNDLFLSSPTIAERIVTFLNGGDLHDEQIDVDVLKF